MSDITKFHAQLREEIEGTLAEYFHIGVSEVDQELVSRLINDVTTLYEGR
jgi:hypothetical protein